MTTGDIDSLRAELIAGLAFRYFTPLVRLPHAKGGGLVLWGVLIDELTW